MAPKLAAALLLAVVALSATAGAARDPRTINAISSELEVELRPELEREAPFTVAPASSPSGAPVWRGDAAATGKWLPYLMRPMPYFIDPSNPRLPRAGTSMPRGPRELPTTPAATSSGDRQFLPPGDRSLRPGAGERGQLRPTPGEYQPRISSPPAARPHRRPTMAFPNSNDRTVTATSLPASSSDHREYTMSVSGEPQDQNNGAMSKAPPAPAAAVTSSQSRRQRESAVKPLSVDLKQSAVEEPQSLIGWAPRTTGQRQEPAAAATPAGGEHQEQAAVLQAASAPHQDQAVVAQGTVERQEPAGGAGAVPDEDTEPTMPSTMDDHDEEAVVSSPLDPRQPYATTRPGGAIPSQLYRPMPLSAAGRFRRPPLATAAMTGAHQDCGAISGATGLPMSGYNAALSQELKDELTKLAIPKPALASPQFAAAALKGGGGANSEDGGNY